MYVRLLRDMSIHRAEWMFVSTSWNASPVVSTNISIHKLCLYFTEVKRRDLIHMVVLYTQAATCDRLAQVTAAATKKHVRVPT